MPMSDQEMHFAEPDWQPSRAYAPQQSAPDSLQAPPRNHHGPYAQEQEEGEEEAAYAPYEEGYRIHQENDEPFQGFRGQSRAQQWGRKKRGAWFWALLVLILGILISLPFDFEDLAAIIPGVLFALVAVLCVLFCVRLLRVKASATISETHTFDVAMQPKIVIKNDFGAIRVHAGEDRQVIISTTKQGRGLLGNPTRASIQYEQNNDKNRINVKARTGWHVLARQQIDFDISVPRLSDLDIKTEAGSITVAGVNGQVNCASDAGTIKVRDVMLRGDSRLKTDAGTVTFDGSLDPHGSYTMTTDAGSVSVTLPAQASFKLDARTDVGGINSDFPVSITRDFPGAKARGEVGFPPYPSLKLRTDVGSINVRES
jgi:hypothetical protein